MRRVGQHFMIHILVAILLSLVINFSYLLMPIITENGVGERKLSAVPAGEHTSGVLHLDSDMHGSSVTARSATAYMSQHGRSSTTSSRRRTM